MEELEKQNFSSIEEANEYLKKYMGSNIDNLPGRTDKKGRSQDLVFDAYEQPVSKGKKLIKQALELDPDNADAYNYLASIEKDIEKSIKLYKKAIKAGEKSLGKQFFSENKGHFWGLIETRPYMRAKAGLADCLFAKKEVDQAIEIYEEMLELNPNDNQGVRYLLSTVLLEKGDLARFELFTKSIEDEDCAVWNYNNALYHFKKFGNTAKTKRVLRFAYKSNRFVIDYLLGIKKMPDTPPQYIGIGDENEAVSYVYNTWSIWDKTEGVFDWLYGFKKKQFIKELKSKTR